MHSALVTFLSRYVEWIMVGEKLEPVTIQRTMDINQRSERMNPFPTQNTTFLRFYNPWFIPPIPAKPRQIPSYYTRGDFLCGVEMLVEYFALLVKYY